MPEKKFTKLEFHDDRVVQGVLDGHITTIDHHYQEDVIQHCYKSM